MQTRRQFMNAFALVAALGAAHFLLFPWPEARAADGLPRNLALAAHASAFETYEGMAANLANDGNMDTRWSGIPGHNTGGWFELDWEQPVRLAEVIVFQHDRYVKEMDLQVWDQENGAWVVLEHLGRPDGRLPRVIVCRFKSRFTPRLRLANITNGPSFNEVQVFEEPFADLPVVNLASDADGRFLGMISDAWGSAPVAGAEVSLSGEAKAGPWQALARSDEYGLFFVPMPLGLTGKVSVSARLPGQAVAGPAPVPMDAAGFQYGLTPENLHRGKLNLEGPWRFAPDPPAGFWEPGFDDRAWSSIRVLAHFVMEGFQSTEGIGGYRRRFRAPAGQGRLKLRFDGVYSGAEVWLNGRRLAYHEGGALPFEVDITDAARSRDNLLAVRVTQHTVVSDRLDKMSEYADFPLAGIMRPVYLFRAPAIHIGALDLSSTFDAGYRDAQLTARAAIINESPEPLPQAELELRLADPDHRPLPADAQPAPVQVGPWQRAEVRLALPVRAPRHWEAEHPARYLVEATLKAKGRVLDKVAQQIGFRQTEVRAGQLLINGQAVKIRGTCHHDSHPLLGRAVTEALTRQDLALMKEANLNSLRTSHYPPLPALLEGADELGLYVEDEGSFCWAEGADDLRLTPRLMQLNAELLARDRNHPSVFIWSVCNESSFGYGFERSHEWLRAADPSRPNAGSWGRGSLEILAQHNPITLAGIAEMEKQPKPVLWDECWCIFQGIWGDVAEMWLDPGLRDYYAEPLPAIYARMMQSKNIAGSQIWAWSDDLFCVPNRGLEYGRETTRCHFLEDQYRLPNRGLVGDAPWGVVDGWRRQKPEFWIIKKLHSPVKLKEAPVPLPAPGQPLRLAVENQYDFTDLSELSINWQLGPERGVARAAGAPRQTGELTLRPARAPVAGQVLSLEFRDRAGRLVDAYRLPVGQSVASRPKLRAPGSAPLRIIPENYLAGQGTRVVGEGFELAFDQASGGLRRGVAFGQALLLEAPRVHVLPAATPLSPLPDPLSWRLQELDLRPEGENVRVQLQGSYEHFQGGYDLLITPGGALTVQAAFKYTGPRLLAREIGLAFSVPKDCDLLRWQRRAEWSVYPADHIGRPLGQTRAFASHPEQLPPAWPWAADNSPMGCNDFRSAKRHIDWASISYPNGPGVWVESNGAQHLRALVEADRISVHVNDWYGGTHCGLEEWTRNYGQGQPLEAGQSLQATARLRLAQPEP
jgi:hypothetical protein